MSHPIITIEIDEANKLKAIHSDTEISIALVRKKKGSQENEISVPLSFILERRYPDGSIEWKAVDKIAHIP